MRIAAAVGALIDLDASIQAVPGLSAGRLTRVISVCPFSGAPSGFRTLSPPGGRNDKGFRRLRSSLKAVWQPLVFPSSQPLYLLGSMPSSLVRREEPDVFPPPCRRVEQSIVYRAATAASARDSWAVLGQRDDFVKAWCDDGRELG